MNKKELGPKLESKTKKEKNKQTSKKTPVIF
jgi:hypothetical protein